MGKRSRLDPTHQKKVNLAFSAVAACDRFFRISMPQMNVRDSALDAEAIDVWNRAEVAVRAAVEALNE